MARGARTIIVVHNAFIVVEDNRDGSRNRTKGLSSKSCVNLLWAKI